MKKVLIFGSTSNLCKALFKSLSDCEILSAGRRDADFYFDASSEKYDEKILTQKFDIIINTMAAFGNTSIDSFYETEKVNALGILKILEIAQKTQCRHVVSISSTSAQYNEKDYYYGVYSVSKKHSDELLKLYCKKENINYTILKPSQIYDFEGQCKNHQPFLYSIIEKIKNNENITINGKHDPKRNYIHIDDVANIVNKVIENEIYGEFCCCALKDTKISEIYKITKKLTKSESKLIYDKKKQNLKDLPKCKDYKLYKLIKYKPLYVLKDNIGGILNGKI